MIPHNPHAVIEVGGRRYDSWRDEGLFVGLDVELTTDLASEARWTLFDPDHAYLDSWTRADGIEVAECKVWLGFGDDLGSPLFTGFLARVERAGGTTSLRFYDVGFKMRRDQKQDTHQGTALQIIAALVKRNKIEFSAPTPAITGLPKLSSVKQVGETDLSLAQSLADDIGVVLFARGNTMYAREAAKTGAPVMTITHKKDFNLLDDMSLSYRVPENQAGRPRTVEVRVRGRGGRSLVGESKPHPKGTLELEIKRDTASRSKTKRGADIRADAVKSLKRDHVFTCSVSLLPTFTGKRPDVRDTITLAGLGKLFGGNYLVDNITHRFGPGELETEIELYRDTKA